MKKLLLLFVAAMLVGVMHSPASAAKYTFKLAHAQPQGDFAYHKAALDFKERLEKYSNGQATVVVYAGGQLGTDFNVIKKVQGGGVDMEIMAVQLLGAYFPKMDVYSLPFLFPSYEAFIKVKNSQFHADLTAEMEKATKLKTLAFVGFSFRHFTNSKKPINSPDDMRGLKFRMNQNKIQIASCEALGASAVAMPAAELFSALQQKVVDGQDATLNFASSQKLYEIQKNMALTYHQLSGSCMIMNSQIFAGLPKDVQEAVLKAGKEMEESWQKTSIAEEDKLLKVWEEKGCKITKPELEPFRKAIMPIYGQFADTVGGQKAIDTVRDIIAK